MQKTINSRVKCMISHISPKFASQILYKRAFGKKLNLENPITLNEKLMWLKLNTYYKNSLITTCADKFKVREYLKDKGCSDILNELIDSWDSVDEINWNALPQKFVLKCNHGAGYNLICEDKRQFDIENAKSKLKQWMKEDYWKKNAEVNYKFIKKKIICERYIETGDSMLPEDYKVYCFNGKPKYMMLCKEREKGRPKFYFLNREWNIEPLNKDSKYLPNGFSIEKPLGVDEIFKYAEILSKPFPFVRVDFYLVKGKVIFGELTFTPAAALDVNRLPETDLKFGNMLKLPIS